MLGIVFLVIGSVILLYFVEKRDLSRVGFYPSKSPVFQALAGFILAAVKYFIKD